MAAAALVEPNLSVPTIFVPTSAGAEPQVSVSGVALPPMLTTIGAAAGGEAAAVGGPLERARPEVPRLRVKLTVLPPSLCSTPPSSDRKLDDGDAGAEVRLQRAAADGGAAGVVVGAGENRGARAVLHDRAAAIDRAAEGAGDSGRRNELQRARLQHVQRAGEVRGPAAQRQGAGAIDVDRAAAEPSRRYSRRRRRRLGEMFNGPAPALTVMLPAKAAGADEGDGARAGLDQSARRRAAEGIQHAAAVDRSGDDRVARPVEGQIADDRVQRAVDGQGLSAGHGPGLRPADVDLRVERDAFVGLDAAGGDGQRAAGEGVAGAAGVERQAVGDDGAADGDGPVGAGAVEDGLAVPG